MRGAEHGYLKLMVVQGGGDNVVRQWVQGQWRLMRTITRQLDNSALLFTPGPLPCFCRTQNNFSLIEARCSQARF